MTLAPHCRSLHSTVGYFLWDLWLMKKVFLLSFFPSPPAHGHLTIAACLLLCCSPNKIAHYHISVSKLGVSLLSQRLGSCRVKLRVCKTWGSHSSVIDAVSSSEWFQTFWRALEDEGCTILCNVGNYMPSDSMTSQKTWILNVGYGSCSAHM